MKKFVFGLLFSFMVWPSFALADEPYDESAEISQSEEGQCFFDLTVLSRRSFSEVGLANQWCNTIHSSFGFSNSCFVRRHNDGRWFGDFRHQRRFQGNSYDRIFRGYTQWSDRHLFRGFRFDHHIQFSPRCFGRGSGGPY